MQQDLRILRIVLVPGVVHRFPRASHCQRRDQLQVKALAEQEMSQGSVVVASCLEHDVNGHLERMQVIGKPSKLNCRVEQDQTLAAFPSGRFDQHVMAKLGDVDGYQNDR